MADRKKKPSTDSGVKCWNIFRASKVFHISGKGNNLHLSSSDVMFYREMVGISLNISLFSPDIL